MIGSLKPYPVLKDSGLRWLGKVPEHWEIRRLKQICRLEYGDSLVSEARQHGSVPVFGSNGRVGSHVAGNARGPCVVIGRKGSFGKVHFSPDPVFAIDTTFFVDRRFSLANIRWLYFLLGWLRLDEVNKDSAVPGLDRGDAYQRIAPFPPISEQTSIARFLDHVNSRIDRYIRAEEKLISLLEEQKQAIVHEAVTGRVDVRTGQPYPTYKPSGVEWLDNVPKHWTVARLGSLGTMSKGGGGTKEDEAKEGVPCVRYGDLYTSHKHFITKARSNVALGEAPSYTPVEFGDVLFAASGETIDDIGKSAVNLIESQVCCGGDIIILRPRHPIDIRYLGYASNSETSARQKASMGRGFTVMHIYGRQLKRLCLALPPLPEQTAISRFLDTALTEADHRIAKAHRQIDLFGEYRTRLIADVVTGKLDVREAVAARPDVDPLASDGDASAEAAA